MPFFKYEYLADMNGRIVYCEFANAQNVAEAEAFAETGFVSVQENALALCYLIRDGVTGEIVARSR